MRTHKVSILVLFVGLGVGLSFAQTNPDASDADTAILIDVLRAKQAQLQAADPAAHLTAKQAAKTNRQARAKAIAAQRLLAKQEARGPLAAPASTDPSADKLVQALRQRQADVAVGIDPSDPVLTAVRMKQAQLNSPGEGDPVLTALRVKQAELNSPTGGDPILIALRAKQAELSNPVLTAGLRNTSGTADPMLVALRAKQSELNSPTGGDPVLVALRNKQAEVAQGGAVGLVPTAPADNDIVVAALRRAQQDADSQATLTPQDAQLAKAREALQQKQAQVAAAKKAQEQEAARLKAEKENARLKKAAQMAAKAGPVQVLTKEQKLAQLLHRYQNDEITPHQYQAERKKIVAEP